MRNVKAYSLFGDDEWHLISNDDLTRLMAKMKDTPFVRPPKLTTWDVIGPLTTE